MKLYELRDYINETALPDVTCHFVDIDEREFSTYGSNYITGEVVVSYGWFDRKTGITLIFAPDYSDEGIELSRDELLTWLDDLISAHGGDLKVVIRLHTRNNSYDFRDMLTDKMWSQIRINEDGEFMLTNGCSQRPFEYTEYEWEQSRRFAGSA